MIEALSRDERFWGLHADARGILVSAMLHAKRGDGTVPEDRAELALIAGCHSTLEQSGAALETVIRHWTRPSSVQGRLTLLPAASLSERAERARRAANIRWGKRSGASSALTSLRPDPVRPQTTHPVRPELGLEDTPFLPNMVPTPVGADGAQAMLLDAPGCSSNAKTCSSNAQACFSMSEHSHEPKKQHKNMELNASGSMALASASAGCASRIIDLNSSDLNSSDLKEEEKASKRKHHDARTPQIRPDLDILALDAKAQIAIQEALTALEQSVRVGRSAGGGNLPIPQPILLLETSRKACPALDLALEIRRADQWCVGKDAWKRNWRKFLANWFSKSQDWRSSGPKAGQHLPPTPRYHIAQYGGIENEEQLAMLPNPPKKIISHLPPGELHYI